MMTIRRESIVATLLFQRCLAVLAIGLLLWTANAALSSRGLILGDLRVPAAEVESHRPADHSSTLPLAALDADGDNMPDLILRQSVIDLPDPPLVHDLTGPTAARRLTGRQLTPPYSPPR